MHERQVWYTSLAFGGFRSDSKADVQQAHLLTEDMMRQYVLSRFSEAFGRLADPLQVRYQLHLDS